MKRRLKCAKHGVRHSGHEMFHCQNHGLCPSAAFGKRCPNAWKRKAPR